MLWPEAMLMYMIPAALQSPCSQSVLHIPKGHKDQISYVGSDIHDCTHTQVRKRDMEDFCDNLLQPKQEAIKRNLKNCDRMLVGCSPQQMASNRGQGSGVGKVLLYLCCFHWLNKETASAF